MGGVLFHCVLREPGSCLSSQGVAAEEEGGEVPLIVVHIGVPAKVTAWGEQEIVVMVAILNGSIHVWM